MLYRSEENLQSRLSGIALAKVCNARNVNAISILMKPVKTESMWLAIQAVVLQLDVNSRDEGLLKEGRYGSR